MATAPYQLDLKNNETFKLISLGMPSIDEAKPRTKYQSSELRLSPRDKPTYSSRAAALRADGNGQDQSVTVAVEEYEQFPMGTLLETAGPTWITPYVRDNRIALSVVCERLVPAKVDDTAAGLPSFGDDK